MKQVAVLLTVFNRKENTLRCLDNLSNLQLPENYSFDVYLTNDGCTDGTPEAVRDSYPEVCIIEGDGNLFWNRGMYTAWDYASKIMEYDYFLWLNDDTFLYKNALSLLIEAAEKTENKSIIVGATVDSVTKKIMTYGGRLAGGRLQPLNGKMDEVDYFNGNIVLVPSSVYCILGNLDYYFTHSKGDFDYGLRAKRKGIKMYQIGEVLGECDVHPRMDKWCDPEVPFKTRWKLMNRPNGMPPKETFYFERRHFGIIKASFHSCSVILRCLFPILWIKTGKVKTGICKNV